MSDKTTKQALNDIKVIGKQFDSILDRIKQLESRLNDCENALVSQIKYFGNGTLHTEVVQYRHKYHGGRQI